MAAHDSAVETELERSPEARQLAEKALVGLLHGLDGAEAEIIVLGGLVPEILTSGQDPPAPPHLGTTDVDLLLVTHLTLESDLGHVERALTAMSFKPVNEGWRWRGRFGGPAVKIEFLCDLATKREFEMVELRGCESLVAQNLRGTGYVARDWTWKQLAATLPDGRSVEVKARFAQLAGYLLSKLVAARTRGAEKDFYDLAYVLLHNRAGGPDEAARRVVESSLGNDLPGLNSTLVEIAERYRSPNGVGPSGFSAEFLKIVPEASEAELRADAVAAVGEFLEGLSRRRG
jgi:hypothetical protein